ncbi:hypothetical protein [Candidatus Palauibacter soopunensis]|uniref:hypothetical protein n=1 Tax=Candidatus Palauibacter soopunensis TaxID=3056739 RepID=UPI0023925538|nr:hypothetical protein [Candidatus Palauibacter soopunensis]MDE2880088.1 hypothetical protein [Candidatus Palauibacter soopunensis]
MTSYEERLRHRDLLERATDLRRRLEAEDGDSPMRREEGAELAALVEATLAEISPERWDRVMETIAGEAARRAGAGAAPMFD